MSPVSGGIWNSKRITVNWRDDTFLLEDFLINNYRDKWLEVIDGNLNSKEAQELLIQTAKDYWKNFRGSYYDKYRQTVRTLGGSQITTSRPINKKPRQQQMDLSINTFIKSDKL